MRKNYVKPEGQSVLYAVNESISASISYNPGAIVFSFSGDRTCNTYVSGNENLPTGLAAGDFNVMNMIASLIKNGLYDAVQEYTSQTDDSGKFNCLAY